MRQINYYRRLFQTSYQLLKIRAVNLGWLVLLAVLVSLQTMMLNSGLAGVKLVLAGLFLIGLPLELTLVLTALSVDQATLNQTDLLILNAWQRFKRLWPMLFGMELLLILVWLPFGAAGFSAAILNLFTLPTSLVDFIVLQRRIVAVGLVIVYIGVVIGFMAVLRQLVRHFHAVSTVKWWQLLSRFWRPFLSLWLPLVIIDRLAVWGYRAIAVSLSHTVNHAMGLILMIILVSLSLIILSGLLFALVWEAFDQPTFLPHFDDSDDALHTMAWFPTGLVVLLIAMFSFQAFNVGGVAAPAVTVAHRGVVGHNGVPNSIAALQQTVKHHPNFVEIDVQETADGQFVVSHDQRIKPKQAAGSRSIQKLTYSHLAKENVVVNGKSAKLATLSTYLKAAKAAQQRVMVEIKVTPQDSNDMVRRFVSQYGNRLTAQHALIHTMSYQTVLALKQQNANLIVGYILPINLFSIHNLPADFYSLQVIGLNQAMVKQAHSIGAPVFTWTPDKVHQMQMMRVLGTDGQITNRVDRLQQVNRQSIDRYSWAILQNALNQLI